MACVSRYVGEARAFSGAHSLVSVESTVPKFALGQRVRRGVFVSDDDLEWRKRGGEGADTRLGRNATPKAGTYWVHFR